MSPREVGRVSAVAAWLWPWLLALYHFFFSFSVGDCKTIKATPDCRLHSLTMALMATRMRTSLLVGLRYPPNANCCCCSWRSYQHFLFCSMAKNGQRQKHAYCLVDLVTFGKHFNSRFAFCALSITNNRHSRSRSRSNSKQIAG